MWRLVGFLLFLGATTAEAALVTITATAVARDDPNLLLLDDFDPGDQITFAFTYDSETPASRVYNTSASYNDAIIDGFVGVPSAVALGGSGFVWIDNDNRPLATILDGISGALILPFDQYITDGSGDYSAQAVHWYLEDEDALVFQDLSLPIVFSASEFDSGHILLSWFRRTSYTTEPTAFNIFYDVDVSTIGVSVTAVPVPQAAWLFGSALSLLSWMKRMAR